MTSRVTSFLSLALFTIFLIVSSVAFAADVSENPASQFKVERNMNDEVPIGLPAKTTSSNSLDLSGISPGLEVGYTLYDFQKNHSMNRQIGVRGDAHILHSTWMDLSSDGSSRVVSYNAFIPDGTELTSASGFTISPTWSGYVTMDIDSAGRPIIANHRTTGTTEPWVYYVNVPGAGGASYKQMPSSLYSSFLSGNATLFMWPKVAYTDNGKITHVLIADDGTDVGTGKILYVRKTGSGFVGDGIEAPGSWETPIQIDVGAGYNLSPVITASRKPGSQKVVIAWSGARGDGTEFGAPIERRQSSFGQRDNDLYVQISSDGGASWGARRNLTQRPDSLAIGFAPHAKVSALWDSNDKIHLAWTEVEWYGYVAESMSYRGRLVHWDEVTDNITVAHEALWGPLWCNSGVFNLNISNPQLSECGSNLYLTFSQFNEGPLGIMDDCSIVTFLGGANADIGLVVSDNGGVSWDQRRNLTQTYTPDCSAGDCASEAWHSTTRYGIDITGDDFSSIPDVSGNIFGYAGNNYLFVQFIEDLDAGSSIRGEGSATYNAVKVFRFGCVDVVICSQMSGDLNGDAQVNISDLGPLIDYVTNGIVPPNPAAGDVDGDCDIDDDDVAYLFDFFWGVPNGPAPVPCVCEDPQLVSCCKGLMRGNANDDPDDKSNVSDVSYLVDWLFGIPTGPEPACIEEANANGDGDEKANVSDISYLVEWLFGIPTGPEPPPCP